MNKHTYKEGGKKILAATRQYLNTTVAIRQEQPVVHQKSENRTKRRIDQK